MRTRAWQAALVSLPLMFSLLPASPAAAATPPLRIYLDGKFLPLDPAPTIVEDRTLVPLRGLLEAMGATVTWDEAERAVTATKGDRYVRLKIDRRLACLDPACSSAAVLDVPARIIGDRTFIPARFVSQAMGARVDWDGEQRAVLVDTGRPPEIQPSLLSVPTLRAGQVISEPIQLQTAGLAGKLVQYFLLDPATGRGPMMAAGPDPATIFTYTPDPTATGPRLVVAAVRDEAGTTRYADPIPVTLAPAPKVTVTGIGPGGTVTGPISLGNSTNFVTVSAKLVVGDSSGSVEELGSMGAGDTLTWYPQIGHNGQRWIQAFAYDRYGNTYESEQVRVTVQSEHRTNLTGLAEGTVVKGTTGLRVTANYPIEAVKYVMDDQIIGWGTSYTLKVNRQMNGAHTFYAEILDKQGGLHYVGPFNFTVQYTPALWMTGVGPKEVIYGPVTFKANANVNIGPAGYWLTDSSGRTKFLGVGSQLKWTPTFADSGDQTLQIQAKTADGDMVLYSEKVTFRVYMGRLFTPVAVAPTREDFKQLSIRLALPIYRETGHSAAIMVAQSLLESAWGQSTPVDKYTGKVSNNVFGIKGEGPAGSVVHNTWEVYNGVTYRVDDRFRAYNSLEENYRDRITFLTGRAWYAPYRAVMTDAVQAAWGLKRSGYATDPAYPTKLINLMKAQDLFKLDEVEL